VTRSGAPGSRIVFTYVDVALLEENGDAEPPWSAQVARVGEPFRYGLDPAVLDDFLAERGLRKVWDVSSADAIREGGVSGGRDAPAFYRIAEAEVVAGA